ncbi:MAG TPA: rRNA maturation RNase YbeY [Longimicrobiales bacterium]|nr:rRNA maturation RNase YbeY [Longimicrobiales bacterium]
MSVEVEVNHSGTEVSDELQELVVHAVEAVLAHQKIVDASISVTLLGDEEITEMNREYLEHDRVTDVISFPLFDEGEEPVGDVYIGFDQAKRQAEDSDVTLQNELARLAIHGTLHVLGFDHPEEDDRTTSEMWSLQEQILKTL